jgi:hypothetical protein
MTVTSKARLGAGNVDIELGGETLNLRPNLKAAQTISRQTGGIRAAIEAVTNFDLDAMVTVIGLGLGLDGKALKELPERIYETGMGSLVAPVTRYLVILANGGRMPDDEGGEGEKDPRD